MGYQAGVALNTGQDNVLLGTYAGYQLTDGTKNVLVGASAGENLSTNTNFNVMVGYQAG